MTSIIQVIGQRPAKHTAGQSIGEAIKAGGAYYGELALEKKNAESLASAREYSEEMRDEQRTHTAGLLEESNTRDDALLSEGRDRDDAIRLENQQRQDAEPENKYPGSRIVQRMIDGDEIPHQIIVDSEGNDIKDLGADGKYSIAPDGTLVSISAGNAGATKQTRTEAATKLGIHATNLESGLAMIETALGVGYDLESGTAFYDQMINKLGTVGRWGMTEAGKLYTDGVARASEALFKSESGAAGSDQEAARYRSFFPTSDDSPEIVNIKLAVLNVTQATLKEASSLTHEDAALLARAVADREAALSGYALIDGDLVKMGTTGNSESTIESHLSTDDDDWLTTPLTTDRRGR